MNLSKNQIRLLMISNVACWGMLVLLFITGFTAERSPSYKVLSAERINIVNADGKPVMAICSKERIAPPVAGGKEYPVEVSEGRKYLAGIILFNETGDEMGGLLFNSFKMPNGRVAGMGHFSFDRFNDNQVLALQYNENRNGVKSGLTVYDRPGDGTFRQSLDLIEEAYSPATTAERKEEIRAVLKKMSAGRELGSERLFIGTQNRVPQLLIRDDQGNPRIRLFVDGKNSPRLQFLDERGAVVSEFPQKKSTPTRTQ
jgi:hypothetical protein